MRSMAARTEPARRNAPGLRQRAWSFDDVRGGVRTRGVEDRRGAINGIKADIRGWMGHGHGMR